jgi:phosphopantothenoylcysteine synthetase/decarboxylase
MSEYLIQVNLNVMMNPPFVAENERVDGYTHVLLITTGSVASVKAPLIVSELLKVNTNVTQYSLRCSPRILVFESESRGRRDETFTYVLPSRCHERRWCKDMDR